MIEHTVKSFERELQHVKAAIARMGELVLEQFQAACRVLESADDELAERIIAADRGVDALELDVANSALKLLALRQPMADDLRETLAAVKIAGDLERAGDLAKGVAKRARIVIRSPHVKPVQRVVDMGALVATQLEEVVRAYADHDAELARSVWARDQVVDDWHESLFRELLTYMMEDARMITVSTHLLFIGKNVERIGDHCANIANTINYVVNGEPLADSRPKGADSRATVVEKG